MTIIYLYVKIHNITGLKYLGKTTKDPFKYTGSGKYWLRHLAKHGSNVSTTILFQTSSPEEFKKVGFDYSRKWNIVESDEWANLMEETGTGGDNKWWETQSEERKKQFCKDISDRNIKRWSEATPEDRVAHGAKTKKNWENPAYRKKVLQSQKDGREMMTDVEKTLHKQRQSSATKTTHANRSQTERTAISIKSARTRQKTPKSKCPHCAGHFDFGNAKRWHFDKCNKRD